ncbi:MAG: septum site-determining protein MinC [Candidatus Meridianibacter frigidus]|nr:MAG: septum site-determining protein MinC [Candidatus Eremiobacteraeota bacterium]
MPAAATVVSIAPFERASATLYHVGTVRGGQSLHHVGNIVVVGDVNPGSELVASGDILVFGSLRGVAHAGAQGDAGARVYALELAATQLRIATFIAAEEQTHKRIGVCPEVACVLEGRITIAAHDRAAELPREDAH